MAYTKQRWWWSWCPSQHKAISTSSSTSLVLSCPTISRFTMPALPPTSIKPFFESMVGTQILFQTSISMTSQSHLFFALNPTPIHKTSSLHISNHYSMLPCIFVSLSPHFYVNFHSKQEESLSSTTP